MINYYAFQHEDIIETWKFISLSSTFSFFSYIFMMAKKYVP